MTQEFIRTKFSLKDSSHIETDKFTKLCGAEYLNTVISWFERALRKV